MMYYVVLCYIILDFTIWSCIVFYFTMLPNVLLCLAIRYHIVSMMLCHMVLYGILMLYHIKPRHILQRNMVWYKMMNCYSIV